MFLNLHHRRFEYLEYSIECDIFKSLSTASEETLRIPKNHSILTNKLIALYQKINAI